MVPHGRKFFLEARYSGCGSISISSRNMNYDPSQLPPDCPRTCSFNRTFFSAPVIWGLVGPCRIFGGMGYYSHMNWFFLAGALEWKCLLMKLMMLFWIRGIGCIDGARVWFQVG